MSAAVVGRGDEVERLLDLVRGAVAGRGATVLLEGEPGIGKTTLLDLVAVEARRLGIRLLRGAGEEWAQRLPFAAIGSCLGLDASDGDRLGQVAALLHGGRDTADQQFIVTEAILDLVRRWCTVSPIALIMDDAQWADRSSLVVLSRLERAIEELPLLVMTARRPIFRGEVPDPLLPALDADGAVSLTLGPLRPPAVAALVAHLVGAPPDAGLSDLVAGAGGNPRYVSRLLDALTREGRLQTVAGAATVVDSPNVPESLVEVIRHRLDFLSSQAREVLRVAAVLAPRFTITELSTVLGTSVIALWDVVNEALNAGLLAEAQDELVFQHELIRQALIEDLSPNNRRSLRLRAAKALAAAGAPAERVAEHLRADVPLDAEAVDWLVRVAGPLTVRAPELAVDLLDRALRQGLMHGDAPRLQLARALLWAGRPADAERTVRSALADGAEAGPDGVALCWLLAQACFQQGQVELAIAEAGRVLAGAGVPAAMQSRLHGFIGQCLLLLGGVDAADAAATQALAPAAASADAYGTAYGLHVKAAVRLMERRPEQALDFADRAVAALGVQEIRPDLQLAPHAVRGFCLLELDRADEADAAFETGLRQSERGGRAFLTWHYIGRARTRFLTGEWDDALAEIRAGLDAIDPLGVAAGLQSQAVLIAMHRGDFGTFAEMSGQPDTSLGGKYWDFLRVTARALAWEAQGKPVRALDLLMRHWERAAGKPKPVMVQYLCPDIARLAVTVGASDQVRHVAVALDRLTEGHPTPTVRGTAALCRGAADRNPDLLLAAAHEYQLAGRPLYEGHAYELASAVFAQRRRAAQAHSALDAAMDRYKRLDAGWDSERAAGLLRRAGLRRRRVRQAPRIGWTSLTETERKIAILVAAGRSSSDIAAELFLSRRTVQGHVSRILAKLGLSSRVELVTAVIDNDNHSVSPQE